MTRPALIILRSGESYTGSARIESGFVHCDRARLRIHHTRGVDLRLVGARSWPRDVVEVVRWESEVAA
jgi:hypothetical protein